MSALKFTGKSSCFIKIPKYGFVILSESPFRRGVILESELVYYSDILGDRVYVPGGFQSDGASVPKFLWDRFQPFDRYLEAAIVHDLYCVLGSEERSPIDDKAAARIFREAMKVCGIGRIRRNLMYQAVRWFGPRFKKQP
jgi:hypothetical protein